MMFCAFSAPQAFRHLYVLATEPRCIEAIDVETHEAVYVPIKVTLNPSYFRKSSSFLLTPSYLINKTDEAAVSALPVPAQREDPMSIESEGPQVWEVSFERTMPCLIPERPMVQCIWILYDVELHLTLKICMLELELHFLIVASCLMWTSRLHHSLCTVQEKQKSWLEEWSVEVHKTWFEWN